MCFGCKLQHPLIGFNRLVGLGRNGQCGSQQVVRLDIVRLEPDRLSELLDGLFQAALLLECEAEVDLRQDEIRGVGHCPPEQALRLVNPAGLQC